MNRHRAEAADIDTSLLKDVIDMHIHTYPDIRERRLNDIELAMEAKRVGARAIVIKSHLFPTMNRAWIAEKVVPGVRVFGAITLNPEVGGINPQAVDAAIKMGAKVVWLPTSSSSHERRLGGKTGGVESVVDNKLVPSLIEVLKLIAKNKVVLGTGHLSFKEIKMVIEEAKKLGVKKIVVTHPEWWSLNMSIEEQKQLVPYGVYFERCYACRWPGKDYAVNFEKNLRAIEALGHESTIISTDGGQVENPMWSEALSQYLQFMIKAGVSKEILDKMTKVYPADLLDLA